MISPDKAMNAEGDRSIEEAVKDYVMQEFLPGEDPDDLTDSTELVTGGILDSLGTVKLALYLEEHYGIEFEPHEMSVDNLDTIVRIARTVRSKLAAKDA